MANIKHIFTDADTNKTITSIVRPQDWNSDHAITMWDGISIYSGKGSGPGGTSGTLNLLTGGGKSATVYFYAGSNMTMESFGDINTLNANYGVHFHMRNTLGSYENISAPDLDPLALSTGTYLMASFGANEYLTADVIRLPAFLNASNTSQASFTGNQSYTYSYAQYLQLGLYKHRTFVSTAEGPVFFNTTVLTQLRTRAFGMIYSHVLSYSAAGKNTNQSHSATLFYDNIESYPVAATVDLTYTTNVGSVTFFSSGFSNFSGLRWIRTANPLTTQSLIVRDYNAVAPPGAFWLMMGLSTEKGGDSNISNVTAAVPRLLSIYGCTVLNSNVGGMGNSDRTNGFNMGAGKYNNGQNSLPEFLGYSEISSVPSHQRLYFIMESPNTLTFGGI